MENDIVDENQRSRLLTIRQASRLLNVHPNTIRRWSDEGIIKSYRIGPRGDRRFRLEDVNRLIVGKTENNGTCM
jgi:excisionase family DNA binding protein